MERKRIISLFLAIVLLFCGMTTMTTVPASAVGKEEVNRTIAIVYDNSGSMYMNSNKAWCQALYAVQVFAMMMNPGDKLLVYPMNPIGPEGEEAIYTRDNPLVITGDAQKNIINTLQSNHLIDGDGTPIESIDCAIEGLRNESADEKWLVVLTDGNEFHEFINGSWVEYSAADTKLALEKRFSQYVSDAKVLYLGIGVNEKNVPEVNTSFTEFYQGKSVPSAQVLTVLTEMCNMIFGRDTLPKNHVSSSSIDFDIPLSKLYVFIQGDGIDNVKLMKDGKELKPSQSFAPTYATAGCITKYDIVRTYKVDTTLKGHIAVYNDLESGTYTYSYTGNASSTAFYYEVDADLQLLFTREDGTSITSAEEVTPGNYYIEYALVDKDGNVLKSDLLGNVDFDIQYTINGDSRVEKSNNFNGKMPVYLDEDTEFSLKSAEVNFLSGYKIRKTGGALGFLAIPFRGIKSAAKTCSLELSGGAKEVDADLINSVPSYLVSVIYDGRKLTGSELDKVNFTAEISGTGIEFEVEQTDSGFEIKLMPDAGLTAVPADEYIITMNAIVTSDTVADSIASATTNLKVNEVSDKLSVDLSYFSTTYSTIDGKAPEITATVKFNGEKLTSEQFDNLEFTVESDGLDFIVTPLPDKSAFTITPNTEVDVELGEYPLTVTATGIKDRTGKILTAGGEMEITVQLLPQWLVFLIWIIAILILALIIWLVLRMPVLPKVIDFNEGNIRVSIDGEVQKVLTATVDYPKKGKKRTITIEASPGALSNVYISATLVPAKDSYRYLPSHRRRAMVVHDSVEASRNVSNISMGNVRFSRDEKNALQRKPAGTEDFEFPMSRVNFTGVKSIHGRNTDFSITGNIIFKDRR